MEKAEYTLKDIDERVLRYFDAYIKQTLRYTKIDFIKKKSCEREYADLIKEHKYENIPSDKADYDRYIYGKIQLDDNVIEFESETVYNQIMRLTGKQQEVLLKNVALEIPMEEIAKQMGIGENKVYKHKKNALSTLARRMKYDEI